MSFIFPKVNIIHRSLPNLRFLFSTSTGTGTTPLNSSKGSSKRIINLIKSLSSDFTTSDVPNNEVKYAKRKVAIVVGYIGTNYYGLQMDPNSNLTTIEGTIENALHKAGFISDKNHGDLTKIGWSRSSRTDKGVHAARIVFSAKLLLHPSWIERLDNSENSREIFEVVDKLSPFLPEDIRVFSCVKVNQGFMARYACTWREYEYLIPADLLLKNTMNVKNTTVIDQWVPLPTSILDAIIHLNTVFQKMEGPHSFHNFHKLSNRDMKKKKPIMKNIRENVKDKFFNQHKQEPASQPLQDNFEETKEIVVNNDVSIKDIHNSNNVNGQINDDDDVDYYDDGDTQDIDDDEEEELLVTSSDGSTRSNTVSKQDFSQIYKEWNPTPRERTLKVRGTMYIVQADNKVIDIEGKCMIRVVIKGQSFILHQIRIMIASAILVCRGVMPLKAIDMALLSSYYINLPMAPAQGLSLLDAGFSKNSNKQDYAMSSKTSAFTMQKNANNELVKVPVESLFMNDEEYQKSEIYRKTHIYKRIALDWTDEEIQNWITFIEKFRVSKNVNDIWQLEVDALLRDVNTREIYIHEEEANRIRRNIEKFNHINTLLKQAQEKQTTVDKNLLRQWKHKSFLPNAVSTELIRRFHANPGMVMQNTLKALSSEVAEGKIPATFTVLDLVDLVERTGGLEAWSTKPKHPLIEG